MLGTQAKAAFSKAHGEHGRRIVLKGQPELEPANVLVPADPSSAAFPLVAALLAPGSELVLEAVMTNPLRTGLLTTLREMGASIEVVDKRDDGGFFDVAGKGRVKVKAERFKDEALQIEQARGSALAREKEHTEKHDHNGTPGVI